MPDDSDIRFAEKKKSKGGFRRIWSAFGYTFSGFASAFRNEHAFRQEIYLFVPATIFALVAPIDWIFKIALLLPLPLVLAVELLNSSLEAVVDDISLDYRELAKRAKDFGSAAVFCAFSIAIIVWVAVLVHCASVGQFDAWFAPADASLVAKK